MFRDWVNDHFFQYVLLLAVVGLMLGVVATYLITFILAIHKIATVLFSALSGGPAGG